MAIDKSRAPCSCTAPMSGVMSVSTLNNALYAAGQYTEANVKMAEAQQDFVMGFISMTPAKWACGPGSPGENLQNVQF